MFQQHSTSNVQTFKRCKKHEIIALKGLKYMQKPLVSTFSPILGAHISDEKDGHSDLNWKEMDGLTANLVANSGVNKGKLPNLGIGETGF